MWLISVEHGLPGGEPQNVLDSHSPAAQHPCQLPPPRAEPFKLSPVHGQQHHAPAGRPVLKRHR